MQSKQLYLIVILIFVGAIACNLSRGVTVSSDVQAIYDENCAGCHGTQLQHFKR